MHRTHHTYRSGSGKIQPGERKNLECYPGVTPVYTPDYDLRRETVSVMLLEQEEIASVGCDVCAQINSPQALGGRVQTPLGRPGCDMSTLGGGVRTPPAKRHPYFIGGGQRHPHSRTRIALKSRRNRLKIPLVG